VSSSDLRSAASSGIGDRVLELRDRFTDAAADGTALLCDDHPVDSPALTTVDVDSRSTTKSCSTSASAAPSTAPAPASLG
jgi:hypothetical protein